MYEFMHVCMNVCISLLYMYIGKASFLSRFFSNFGPRTKRGPQRCKQENPKLLIDI